MEVLGGALVTMVLLGSTTAGTATDRKIFYRNGPSQVTGSFLGFGG